MAVMQFVKQASGGGGPVEQTLEQTKKWAKLRRACEANGQMDVRVKVIGIKHPHAITTTVNGVKKLVNWGEDTPEDQRFKENDRGDTVPMKPGVLVTFEAVEPGIEGLRFYASGTYSSNEKTPIFRVGNAIYRGQLIGKSVDPDVDFIDRELIVTVKAGGERTGKTVDGHPVQGGVFWNVKDYRPVPQAVNLLADDDEPVMAQGALPSEPRPDFGGATPAPRMGGATSPTPGPVLDDDDDVPF